MRLKLSIGFLLIFLLTSCNNESSLNNALYQSVLKSFKKEFNYNGKRAFVTNFYSYKDVSVPNDIELYKNMIPIDSSPKFDDRLKGFIIREFPKSMFLQDSITPYELNKIRDFKLETDIKSIVMLSTPLKSGDKYLIELVDYNSKTLLYHIEEIENTFNATVLYSSAY